MTGTVIAVYALSPIGVGGALEANGEVHFYCSAAHADASASHRPAGKYSEPQTDTDAPPGTICEHCHDLLVDAEPAPPLTGPPASTQSTIFRDHSCYRCRDGTLPCVAGHPHRCEFPHARND